MNLTRKLSIVWKAPLRAGSVLILVGAAGVMAPPPASAQEYYDDIEWEAGEGYHEEEWYDPSDWFDLDEGVEYEYDFGDTYGYVNDTDDWYYDYYDDSYVYDDYGYEGGVYTSMSDFYDFDNDGVYEAYASYEDLDGDGLYEDFDYYRFSEVDASDSQAQAADKESQQQAKEQQRMRSSKTYAVTGEVQKTKKVQVRQGQNLVAQVKTNRGLANVDLGPADQAAQWDVSEGTELAARGPLAPVGDKKVLLAKAVKIGDQQASIDRTRAKVTGTIKNLKTASVRGTEHQLAVVDSKDKKKKLVVDMGPAANLSHEFSEGDEVTIHGVPVRVSQRPTLFAQKVQHEDQTIAVDRRER